MWEEYPETYRAAEVARVIQAVKTGESAALVGLSGAGKSNALGFIANAPGVAARLPGIRLVAVDCNRLREPSARALFVAMRRGLGGNPAPDGTPDALEDLDEAVAIRLREKAFAKICFVLDRFDALQTDAALPNNLRALRDAHKFKLSFVTGARRPPDAATEFAELVYANTIWLGCLSESDARWNVARYAARKELAWDEPLASALIVASRGYPSFLRACCEAYAQTGDARPDALGAHPAARARVDEFWADTPTEREIELCGLAGLPLLYAGRAPMFDTAQLTAKELALLRFLQARPNAVCEKDEIIRAVWSEDKAFVRGIRDDSLAQLARRLREKIEPDPNTPRWVVTVPGRGYKFVA